MEDGMSEKRQIVTIEEEQTVITCDNGDCTQEGRFRCAVCGKDACLVCGQTGHWVNGNIFKGNWACHVCWELGVDAANQEIRKADETYRDALEAAKKKCMDACCGK
jgi:hypothetical protein